MPTAASSTDLNLPAPESLARGDFDIVIRRLADDLAFGSDTSRLLGSGLEYASSRPYIPGDSVRLLNWRLTARTGRAYVREYEALKRTSVYIFIDTSASMAVRSVARSKHDLAIWIASALGLVAQRRMSPVALVGAGERTVALVASLSRNDLWQSLERCARMISPRAPSSPPAFARSPRAQLAPVCSSCSAISTTPMQFPPSDTPRRSTMLR